MVFTSKEGKIIHPDKIYHALKISLAAVGFRRGCASTASHLCESVGDEGVDLLSIKTLMGHTDLKTTQIYAHLAPQHLRDVVKVLNVSEPKSA